MRRAHARAQTQRQRDRLRLRVATWLRRALVAVLLATPLTLVHASEFREAASQNYFADPAGINLETATAIVRRKTGGRVLSAAPASRGAERGYKVRVLVEDKLVQTWFVDKRGRTDR